MKSLLIAAAGSAALLAAAPANAQDYQTELLQILQEAAQGKCSPDKMSSELVAECEKDMPQLAEFLQKAGPVEAVIFEGMQDTGTGPAEVYTIAFANRAMVWLIKEGDDGKLVSLWSPG